MRPAVLAAATVALLVFSNGIEASQPSNTLSQGRAVFRGTIESIGAAQAERIPRAERVPTPV